MKARARRKSGGSILLGAFLAPILLLAFTAIAGRAPAASAQEDCTSTIDLVLVLDGSESITPVDFDKMKLFAGRLVGHFTISEADAHAGVLQFAGEGEGVVEIGLSAEASAIDGAISAMVQIVGATDIQEGIALGQQQLDAGGREGVPKVMIVLTDGAHNQPGDPVAEAQTSRGAGTEIFTIAVGPGPDVEQLHAIASEPGAEHVLSVSDFDGLARILEPLVQEVCPPTPTPEPTATPPPVPQQNPLPPPDEPVLYAPPVSPQSPLLPALQLPETGLRLSLEANDAPLTTGANRKMWRAVEALAGLGGTFLLACAVVRLRARGRPGARPWA